MAARRGWTRDETILAIELYCRTRFGRIHKGNKEIIDLAARIGRTASSVALKMTNFASIDPTLDRRGMSHASALDRSTWSEFFSDPAAFLEDALRVKQDHAIEYQLPEFAEADWGLREGGEYVTTTKARINQDFFRKMILASYNDRCCITGIDIPGLLVASHIKPWAANPASRLDPRNGLCLNSLHDKAFEIGLISFDNHYRVLVSSQIGARFRDFFGRYEHATMDLPGRFRPSKGFLEEHRESRFIP
jgi:putative restriction endonuclease